MRLTERQLRRIVRESILSERPRGLSRRKRDMVPVDDDIIPATRFGRAMKWIKSRGASGVRTAREFLINLKTELSETRQGVMVLSKLARRQPLEPNEMEELKDQMKDVVRGVPLLALLVLPGGGVATMALIKIADRVGVELKPSAFRPPPPKLTYRQWADRKSI